MGRRRKNGLPINGWVNLDKPLNMGSTQAVSKVRYLFQAQKAGHAGTLDPLATGILPIALGEATKTVPYAQDCYKTYQFDVTWGESRSTDDLEGDVVDTSDFRPSEEDVLSILSDYIGDIEQTPPAFSAIKVDGERAYDLARSGADVNLKSRIVTILDLQLVTFSENVCRFEVHCGKGTYVRSLARDMGKQLGCYGHVSYLRRTAVGEFTENNSISLESLEKLAHSARLNDGLLLVETALDDIPVLALTEVEVSRIRHGQALSFVSRPDMDRLIKSGLNPLEDIVDVVVATHKGDLIALCEVNRVQVSPIRVFNL